MLARIEAIDVDTGDVEVLLETNIHIEAPNWAPDNSCILVNASGRFYRVPLDRPRLELVYAHDLFDTNNDHGLSPDGRTLAITDRSARGTSSIYLMPMGSTEPILLTPEKPSWFHSWAPDGGSIAYTCLRNERWGIGWRSVTGGNERILIQAEPGTGHRYDGPDYTPDGRWIWFNCERDGAMALWRMRPDGSAPEQMTDGVRPDWFPHPSPDGRHVCFLSYAPGTKGHPFGQDVELRLMPATGGRPQILTRIHGGQGTMNVPNWSPDGRRFAYIRYSPDTPWDEDAVYI